MDTGGRQATTIAGLVVLMLAGVSTMPCLPAASAAQATIQPTTLTLQVPAEADARLGVDLLATVTTASGGAVQGGNIDWFVNGELLATDLQQPGPVHADIRISPGSGTSFPLGNYTVAAYYLGSLDAYGPSSRRAAFKFVGPQPEFADISTTASVNSTDSFGRTVPGTATIEPAVRFPLPTHFSVMLPPTNVTLGSNINMSGFFSEPNGSAVPGCTVGYLNGQVVGAGCSPARAGGDLGIHPSNPGDYNFTVVYVGWPTYAPSEAQFTFHVVPTATTEAGASTSQGSTTQSQSEAVAQPPQVDLTPLSFSIIIAAAIIALGIVVASRTRRRGAAGPT